jgi:ABC-type multidrug transport system fused ATPase/permease subunit
MFDLRFGTLLTPALVPLIYRAVVALAGLSGLAVIVLAALHAWWLGLIALLVVPLVVVLVVALTRVFCELLWYISELHEDVSQIGARFARMEGVVSELAEDMPKLNFLRRGASNRERSAAGAAGVAPDLAGGSPPLG